MNERIAKLMENPKKGLLILAWPMILSTFFSTLLNIVDFFFVGGLGPNALAAVQLSFPIFFLIIAVGSGISIGATSLIAKRLGEKNKEWAEETGLHTLLLAVILAVAVTCLAPFAGEMSKGLGGSPEVARLTADYIGVIFLGAMIFFPVFAFASMMQAEGDTKRVMKMSVTFTVANIILDPIFIYTLGMGVKGAAIATVLAEAIAFSLYIRHIIVRKASYLQIHPRRFIYTPQIIKNILKVGLPMAVGQIGLSIASLAINLILSGFGDRAISAYGIGFRVDSLAIMPVLGLGAGAVPLIGYFRGRKDFKGARKVQRYALKLVVMYGIGLGAVMFLLAGVVPSLFTNDPGVLLMASDYLKIMAVSYPFFGIAIITSSSFQGLGKGMPSLVIMLSRTVAIAIPLCYYLANYTDLGVNGVLFGIVISAVASAAMAVVWIESVFRKLCGARK